MAHLYAMHDWSSDWTSLVRDAGKTGWAVISEEIGDDPQDRSGNFYWETATCGITPIVRLNYSHHGNGTIPLPAQYDAFAARCANFVDASRGCIRWVIGNEPNIRLERFGDIPITPQLYAQCFRQCRNAIKQRNLQHEVIVAAIAPYNAETGWCIDYWVEMFNAIATNGGADGLSIHCYSRGGNPQSVFSEDKMGAPYSAYYNGFRAYRDFLMDVPKTMRDLPVYITETDQLEPWNNENTGWVRAAYSEIDEWNHKEGTQKIHCLALYRWETFDQWGIKEKMGVIADFNYALKGTDYQVPELHLPLITQPEGPTAIVTAPDGANIRIGPGLSYKILEAVPMATELPITGRSYDSSWWQVDNIFNKGWVSNEIVKTINTQGTPVILVTVPISETPAAPMEDNFARCLRFVLRWEGGWADDPNDSGGATMKGITIGTYTRWQQQHGQPVPSKENLRNIPDAVVSQIYREWYWYPSKANTFAWPMCLNMMDLAVNGGVGRAQEALAAAGLDFNNYLAWRIDWYCSLSQFELYGRAWIRRCADVLREAGKLA